MKGAECFVANRSHFFLNRYIIQLRFCVVALKLRFLEFFWLPHQAETSPAAIVCASTGGYNSMTSLHIHVITLVPLKFRRHFMSIGRQCPVAILRYQHRMILPLFNSQRATLYRSQRRADCQWRTLTYLPRTLDRFSQHRNSALMTRYCFDHTLTEAIRVCKRAPHSPARKDHFQGPRFADNLAEAVGPARAGDDSNPRFREADTG